FHPTFPGKFRPNLRRTIGTPSAQPAAAIPVRALRARRSLPAALLLEWKCGFLQHLVSGERGCLVHVRSGCDPLAECFGPQVPQTITLLKQAERVTHDLAGREIPPAPDLVLDHLLEFGR